MTQLSPETVLKLVQEHGTINNSRDLCNAEGWDHEQFVGVVKSLVSKNMLVEKKHTVEARTLTKEGKNVKENGSPESNVYNAVSAEGTSKADLEKTLGKSVLNIGFSYCMKNKWLAFDKSSGLVKRKTDQITDTLAQDLIDLNNLPKDKITLFKKRKLIEVGNVSYFTVEKGPDFCLEIKTFAAELTADMITSGSWKNENFKPLNLKQGVMGIPPNGGHLHTLLKNRTMMKEIFLEMGFEEMPTNNYVESSFWNFDALFQPQQHPARDAHDTFFLQDPARAKDLPADYVQRVKTMHESGGSGSIGWRYNWSEDEARKNLLRTHTTAVSARMLYQLAQQKEFTPKKYFSIDKVFRNETLDTTHLAEFNQIEGLVADYNLTLGNLMAVIKQFFHKLGITNLKFKPAYNPYTEPSMEIFSWHEGHQRWLEIGNSGIFRPEMLAPMNLPEGVRVIAWGLSLERPTMIKYRYENIRDLVGHKVDVVGVQKNIICRRGIE